MEKWINQIDRNTAEFSQLFDGLTEQELNWKASEDRWSIAQNMDHVITINESYFPQINSIRSGDYQTPFIGKFNFVTSFLGKAILKAVNPDRKKKMKTFTIWEPSSSQISGDIVKRFKQHQEELKGIIEMSSDLLSNNAVISSPANKNIVYKLETAFDIIVTHELRHLEQAKEVLGEIGAKI